jgi:hypothetical protein
MTYQITDTRKILREILPRRITRTKTHQKPYQKPRRKAPPVLVNLVDIDTVPAVAQPGLPGEFYITPEDKVDFIPDACKKRLMRLMKNRDSPWGDEWSPYERFICWMCIS